MEQQIRHTGIIGQSIQAESPIHVLKSVNDLENLTARVPYYFVRKKAEKLVTAVYLVTGFLSDSEPIKWQIRECGLRILSDVNSVADSQVSEMVHRVKSNVGKITALFEIASVAGFVSGMNLAVLKDEYSILLQIIESQKIGKPEGGYVFAKEFFENQETSISDKKDSIPQNDFSKEHFKKDVGSETNRHQVVDTRKTEYREAQNIVSDNALKNNNVPKNEEKKSRKETILLIIKDKGEHAEVSIKDVVGHFSDCGEKTIQRELTALVEEGVLKKTGERRWSRYSIS